ncbi:MAG: hypothetical protein IJN54_08125 [Lachnospiraceae bacterium]|nr:hypothetical protein [Lachnospiraceae bacterium]
MKIVQKIFKIVAAIILIPTVLLIAFILIADATGMEFEKDGKKTEYSVELPSLLGAESQGEAEETEVDAE